MGKAKLSTIKEIHDTLVYFSKVRSNKQFLFTVLKNINLLKEHVSVLQEVLKPNKNYTEYQKKLFNLIQQYGVKDENGKLKAEEKPGATSYSINPEKLQEFTLKLEQLKKDNETLFKELDKMNEEINTILDSEIDNIDFIKIPIALFPDEIDNPELFKVLYENDLIIE